jgi:hypothetical protein
VPTTTNTKAFASHSSVGSLVGRVREAEVDPSGTLTAAGEDFFSMNSVRGKHRLVKFSQQKTNGANIFDLEISIGTLLSGHGCFPSCSGACLHRRLLG